MSMDNFSFLNPFGLTSHFTCFNKNEAPKKGGKMMFQCIKWCLCRIFFVPLQRR